MVEMMLIGMFDSPYVRRVAVTLKHLEIPFEHANWSVGADFERVRGFSPLGPVARLRWRCGLARSPCGETGEQSHHSMGARGNISP